MMSVSMVYLFLSSYFQATCVFWFKANPLCTADIWVLLFKFGLTIYHLIGMFSQLTFNVIIDTAWFWSTTLPFAFCLSQRLFSLFLLSYLLQGKSKSSFPFSFPPSFSPPPFTCPSCPSFPLPLNSTFPLYP